MFFSFVVVVAVLIRIEIYFLHCFALTRSGGVFSLAWPLKEHAKDFPMWPLTNREGLSTLFFSPKPVRCENFIIHSCDSPIFCIQNPQLIWVSHCNLLNNLSCDVLDDQLHVSMTWSVGSQCKRISKQINLSSN